MNGFKTTIPIACISAFVLTACQPKNEFVEPPPPKVTVAKPDIRDVTVFVGLPGRLEAQDSIEIRARVPGYLKSVGFTDGELVSAGDQLFVIEPEPYIAETKAAEASLAQANASRDIAQTNYDRREQAYRTKAVSEIDLLTAKADLDSAEAAVLVAESQLTQAQINLSYTTNVAPATGRISRRLVSVGNFVGQGEATLLTTLVVQDPIHAYFNVAERIIVPKLENLASIDSRSSADSTVVFIELADGTRYSEAGLIDFVDNRIDPETGTVTVRAIFSNKANELIPGLYGRVLIPDERKAAILVPDLAILRDIGGSYVLVVNAENKVESRYITPGPKVENERIVEEGLDGSERIIIEGVQRARPGIVVQPETAQAGNEPKPTEVVEDAV